MKTFEQVSSTMGSQLDDVESMRQKMNLCGRSVKPEHQKGNRHEPPAAVTRVLRRMRPPLSIANHRVGD
jgi:hypothetical protein